MNTRIATGKVEVAAWSLGIILAVIYLVSRVGGEFERRQAIELFSARTPTAQVTRPQASSGDDRTVTDLSLPPLPVKPIEPAPLPTAFPAPVLAALPGNMQHWSPHRIRQFEATRQAELAADGRPVALLRIARVQLEVPVYAEINERNLNRGAALVAGTAIPGSDGNVAIAAHRDGYFRALQAVTVGDVIDVETHEEIQAYRVTAISIVAPTDLWPLEPTREAALTLVTCYPFYFLGSAPQRYIVRAEALP